MANKINVTSPSGQVVQVEVEKDMFFIDGKMFLFMSEKENQYDEIVGTVKELTNDSRRIPANESQAARKGTDETETKATKEERRSPDTGRNVPGQKRR